MFPALTKFKEKDYAQAHRLSLEMIKDNIKDGRPYMVLSMIAAAHGNFNKALQVAQKGQDLAGSVDLDFTVHQATVLSRMARHNEAVALLADISEKEITSAETADSIGVILSRAGRHPEAIPFFGAAIQRNARPANFHLNLGTSRQFCGDFTGAAAAFEAALARDPSLFKAYSGLVGLRKQTKAENFMPALTSLFSVHQQDADAAMIIGHALAKSHEDLGDYGAAFDWLVKAKAGKSAQLERSAIDLQALFDAAKSTTGGEIAPQPSGNGPLFVVGLPRTGTTLIDRILSSHPDVVSAGELGLFSELIKRETASPGPMVLEPQSLRAAGNIDLEPIGRKYLDEAAPRLANAPVFVDKMPLNFFYAALILKALPGAKVIVLRRGAMDSCLSNFRQLFATDFSYYNYTLNLEDTAYFYKLFDDLIAHFAAHLPASRFYQIRYENVISDQEKQTRDLLEFCGLDWTSACLDFHKNDAPVSTASSVQVRQPLYSSSIGRWKKYGARLDPLKKALGDLAET